MQAMVAALALAIGAVNGHTGACMGTGPVAADSMPLIEIQNHRNAMVTVFAEWGDLDFRIGEVAARTTAALPLAPWMFRKGKVELFAQPDGAGDLPPRVFEVKRGPLVLDVPPAPATVEVAGPESPPTGVDVAAGRISATTLTVQNDRPETVVMYADHGEYDLRLGTVRPGLEATFVLPDWLVREKHQVVIFAHPVGGVDLESRTLEVNPHDHLEIFVPVR